ncbi:nitrogen fixation protein NifQ [Azohydromonas australica]|uniref:nitrogen fixation protein NifQ n=1 Tax=Azohydromonas australica TaxID=364039 RepID=UPI000687CEFF|nr:nitrogen fixation protein NifQ [Azohydromonas australica]
MSTPPACLAHPLLDRAMAGVMKGAQDGDLPLWAWTLGLPQAELVLLVQSWFPELGVLERMPEVQYAALQRSVPEDFHPLASLLAAASSGIAPERHTRGLAHAVAAACFGERHLWQDLDLADRESLSGLMHTYFGALASRNTRRLRWKWFLFGELDTRLGRSPTVPAGCRKCEEFERCSDGAVHEPGCSRNPCEVVMVRPGYLKGPDHH